MAFEARAPFSCFSGSRAPPSGRPGLRKLVFLIVQGSPRRSPGSKINAFWLAGFPPARVQGSPRRSPGSKIGAFWPVAPPAEVQGLRSRIFQDLGSRVWVHPRGDLDHRLWKHVLEFWEVQGLHSMIFQDLGSRVWVPPHPRGGLDRRLWKQVLDFWGPGNSQRGLDPELCSFFSRIWTQGLGFLPAVVLDFL